MFLGDLLGIFYLCVIRATWMIQMPIACLLQPISAWVGCFLCFTEFGFSQLLFQSLLTLLRKQLLVLNSNQCHGITLSPIIPISLIKRSPQTRSPESVGIIFSLLYSLLMNICLQPGFAYLMFLEIHDSFVSTALPHTSTAFSLHSWTSSHLEAHWTLSLLTADRCSISSSQIIAKRKTGLALLESSEQPAHAGALALASRSEECSLLQE